MGTRSEILKAADQLFGDVGFSAATTRDIAEASGANKALIHYHFGTKHELFNSVLDSYFEKLGGLLRSQLEGNGTARERFERTLDIYLDFLVEHRNFSRIVQREASGGEHLDRIVQQMIPIFERGIEIVKAAYPATRTGDLSAPQLVVTFYGMIASYVAYAPVLERLTKQTPLSTRGIKARKRHLRRMLDLVMRALEEGTGTSRADNNTTAKPIAKTTKTKATRS